jgi:hypothetical protein
LEKMRQNPDLVRTGRNDCVMGRLIIECRHWTRVSNLSKLGRSTRTLFSRNWRWWNFFLQAIGHRGQPFGLQIKKELFWDTKQEKLFEYALCILTIWNRLGAIWFSYSCEGPPGMSPLICCSHVGCHATNSGSVHGGAIATTLDSCLGFTALRGVGFGHVTLYLNTNYHKVWMNPCGESPLRSSSS